MAVGQLPSSALQAKMDDYDQELDTLLSSKGSIADMQTILFTLQTFLSLGQKQIEKQLSNLSEEDRKVELKKYIGAFNSYPVLVLTFVQVGIQMTRLFCLTAPQMAAHPGQTMNNLLGRAQPLQAPIGAALQFAPLPADLAAQDAKRGEELAKMLEVVGSIFGQFQGVAQNMEQREQALHRSQEEALKFHKQQSLDPAATQASQGVQESLRNGKEVEDKRDQTMQQLMRG